MSPELGGCCAHECVLVLELQQAVVATLECNRRADLHVHRRAAAQRAAHMARPHFAFPRQRQQRVVQGMEDPVGALLLLDREVGSRDVADEQRVAAEHRPRLEASRPVDQGKRRVLGPVSRRVHGADRDAAQLELPAIVERLVLIVRGRQPVDVDRRAGRRGEAAVAGDVVGVIVGLEDVLDPHAHVAGHRQVVLDVELRVDHGGDAGVLVADQVGAAAEVVVDELAEDHLSAPTGSSASSSVSCRRRPPQTSSQSANTPSSAIA
jgi:hypothetical protein